MPTNPETDQRYESLSQDHDQKLDWIIKEINELSDTNGGNDKIESDLIVNNELNEWLKWYLESNKDVAKLLIDKINSIDASNLSEEVKQSLQNLAKLLSWVVNWPVEWDETAQEVINPSFDKFKKIIEEWKLNKLNTLKDREVQDVINFVNDSNNDIASLNLFDAMVKQEIAHGGDKNFRHTDRENFHKVSDAIRTHFNMLEWAWIETAQKIQLDKIFDGMEEENVKKEDLQKIYENYVWWEWDGEPIPENGSVTFDKELIVSSQDFAKKFNSLIPTPEDTEETPEEEWNWGFDKSVEKKWDRMDQNRVDKINAFAWENAFLDLKGDNLSYNLDNVKKFLWTINDDNFNKDFIKVWTDSRYAWLAATQILLNQNLDGDNKLVVDGEYKRWGETYNAVLDFQKNYNLEHSNDGWFVSLKEDWMPGPKTLSKMLWFVAEADNNSVDSNDVVDSSKIDEGLASTLWLKEANDTDVSVKTALNIPESSTVYRKEGDENAYFYKSGNDIVRVSADEPWIKKSINIPWEWAEINTDINSWTSKVDVFDWWKTKLESVFKTDTLKSMIWEENFNNLSIFVSETDPAQYQLKNGEDVISLNDEMFVKDFCGVSKVEDKLNLVYLASELKNWKVSIVSRENAGESYLALSDPKFDVNLSNINFEDFNKYCLDDLGFSLTSSD